MWIRHPNGIIEAGLLLRDLRFFAGFAGGEGRFASFPYSIVLTQACDIESYYRNRGETDKEGRISRQIICQLILCPAFDEDKFKSGQHLMDQYEYQTTMLNSKEFTPIREQRRERYHYLRSNTDPLPNLVLDFRHYFTVPIEVTETALANAEEELYKLEHIHYTDLADRFAHYVQRVAIPD